MIAEGKPFYSYIKAYMKNEVILVHTNFNRNIS